jgi:L-asparagine oxygenase
MKSEYDFTEEEIYILSEEGSKISANPASESELFCKQSKEAKIPQRIRSILSEFVEQGSETGYLLFRGFPVNVNSIEKTPIGNTFHIGEKTELAKVQSIIVSTIGEMIAYEAEGGGRLFQDIVPIQTMATQQTSLSSRKELEIHTEQAFSNLRPDILSLACLRGDTGAFTYVLPVHKIMENMSPDEIDIMHRPLWNTGVDLSFKLNGNEFIEGDIRGPFPILRDGFIRFDQDLMCGITESANTIIQRIVDIYYNHRFVHSLRPGEIILIDNRRALHGRSPFFPKYDGYDRFLIRCFSTIDYEKSEYARENGGRIVAAIYS